MAFRVRVRGLIVLFPTIRLWSRQHFPDFLYQQGYSHSYGFPNFCSDVADLVMEDVESRALYFFFLPIPFLEELCAQHTCCALRTDLVEDFHSTEPSFSSHWRLNLKEN